MRGWRCCRVLARNVGILFVEVEAELAEAEVDGVDGAAVITSDRRVLV